MKRTLTVATLAMLFTPGIRAADITPINTNSLPSGANSYVGRFGAGIILGEPTGASVKYWFNDQLAIDGAIGASFDHDGDEDDDGSDFQLHSDLLWHNFQLLPVPKGRLPVYLGVGGLVKFRNNDQEEAGIRVPVGLSYMFDQAPLDVFVEIAPTIDIAPNLRGVVSGGIGIRFWF